LFCGGAFFILTEKKSNDEREIKKKALYFKKYSPTFIKKLEEENLNLNFLNREGLKNDVKKLKKILSFIENNKHAQVEIKNNIQKIKMRVNYNEELLKKYNYYAFNNLDLIIELKKRDKLLNYEILKDIICKMYPNEETNRKLDELLENNIIKKDYETEKYKLNSFTDYIYHPYKLDDNGKPLLIEIKTLI